ncbi:MAG TPA: hypothetical protein VKR30_08115 [Candidatus Limnocylindrales bacterium]|nr:hypothetical protein [Candidatus Limnocylindrales bacterium]
MFGTLLGGLVAPPSGAPGSGRLEAVLRAQEAAGLEPLTDGRLGAHDPFALGPEAWRDWTGPLTVDAWQAAAAMTDRAVKQALPGPYSLGWAGGVPPARRADRERRTMAAAEALHEEVVALASVGCPLVEIEETAADAIGEDEGERGLFRAAHRRLTDGVTRAHLSLSIVNGSAWEAGPATILDAPYQSLAVDLIAGPDNWRIVAVTPGDRGIVAGALSPESGSDDAVELLIWAANYAASTGGRGLARVGLAIAGNLALPWEQAERKLARLGRAVALLNGPGEELARAVDPRSINIRSAGHGRPMPMPPPMRGARRKPG